MFEGIVTALVTPFKDGAVDEEAYRTHIEWQIEQGVHGLLPCGTTGESATLSHDEHEQVIKICIEQVKKRVPVFAGSGSNNTKEAISLTQFAKRAGADAALLISPYYNKPTQEGIYQHYKAVNDAVSMPLFVYNVPSRTGSNINPETVARMYRELPDVVGIKEAAGNIVQLSNILEKVDDDFYLFSGDDFILLPSLALGARGVISVTANVMPKTMSNLYSAWKAGNVAEARNLHYELEAMNRAMFIETNPVPAKTALHLMGRMSEEVRLPLYKISESCLQSLKQTLKEKGLV